MCIIYTYYKTISYRKTRYRSYLYMGWTQSCIDTVGQQAAVSQLFHNIPSSTCCHGLCRCLDVDVQSLEISTSGTVRNNIWILCYFSELFSAYILFNARGLGIMTLSQTYIVFIHAFNKGRSGHDIWRRQIIFYVPKNQPFFLHPVVPQIDCIV